MRYRGHSPVPPAAPMRRHPGSLGATRSRSTPSPQDNGYAPPRERRHALNGDVGATLAHVAITATDGYDGASGNARHVERRRVFPFTREFRRVVEEQKATFTMWPKSADLRSPIGYDIARFGLPADAPVTSGYEAGRDPRGMFINNSTAIVFGCVYRGSRGVLHA
jgi:hypothetical protein